VSQVVKSPQTDRQTWEFLYAPIEQELAEVEDLLRRELCSRYPCVDEMVKYGCLLGGKRLRPALLLLAGKAVGTTGPEHLVLAAVVEMIHTATLVHDDVLDEASVRRHQATCNSRWDNEASVLLGDYLFTHSFYLASTLNSTHACRMIGKATNIVCEGELRQVHSRGNFALGEAEYLEIIDSKTAELCACSCCLGAYYAGASESLTDRMGSYGRNLGIAFQIADDLLDVLGDEAIAGKSLGTDLIKQKPTLPLIHVLAQANDQQRQQIHDILQSQHDDRDRRLWPWFERFKAFQYARQQARWYAEQARKDVDSLPDSPAKQVLLALTKYVVQRSR